MTSPGPDISVIVMGYRNADTVLASVGSVIAQAVEGMEVLVVSSGGDDTASKLLGRFPGITVIDHPERLLPGGARNIGVARTRGRVVAFLAADCLAEPGWAEGRLARHREGFRAVAGAMTCAPPRRPSSLASMFLLFSARLPGRPAGVVDSQDTAAHGLSYDRALLEELGPFDETLRVGEDTAKARRLGEMGIPIWFEPSVRAAHTGPARLSELRRDQGFRTARRMEARGIQMPDASKAGLLRVATRNGLTNVLTVVRAGLRDGGDYRSRVLVALPWIVAGAAASQRAWLKEQLSARRVPTPTSASTSKA